MFNDLRKSDIVPSVEKKGMLPNASKEVPYLDPTLVKAMIMQETSIGQSIFSSGLNDATKDVMQVNVYYNAKQNDWSSLKKQFGLEKAGGTDNPQESIRAGIGWLFLKGLKIEGGDYQTKKWLGGNDWSDAVNKYNASSGNIEAFNMKRRDFYEQQVMEMKSDSKPRKNE